MQSHPMGYSMFSFGYWAEEPPALDQFITTLPSSRHRGRPAMPDEKPMTS